MIILLRKKILTLMQGPYLESQIFMKFSYLALNDKYLLCVETCKEVEEKLNISLINRNISNIQFVDQVIGTCISTD